MSNTDIKIYKAFLEHLKNGSAFTISSISRGSGFSRQTIHNKIDKYTFQDLEKFKLSS